MAIRNFKSAVEVGSGAPTSVGLVSPRLYLDIDTGILYVKGEGDAGWSAVNGSISGLTSSVAELNAVKVSSASAAVTATSDGLTTGIIADGKLLNYVAVTSSSANNMVTLPSPNPGVMCWINVGANGFKLRSSAPSTVAINGGSGAAAVSAIAASSTILAICISATAWKAIFLDADSDVAKVAAAA